VRGSAIEPIRGGGEDDPLATYKGLDEGFSDGIVVGAAYFVVVGLAPSCEGLAVGQSFTIVRIRKLEKAVLEKEAANISARYEEAVFVAAFLFLNVGGVGCMHTGAYYGGGDCSIAPSECEHSDLGRGGTLVEEVAEFELGGGHVVDRW
jgi:hypothetical protein